MMILRSSPTSPFGRKVKIAARLLGLSERLEIVAADPSDPKDSLREQNPLAKIPVLILEDGAAIYDSRVICEYLDSLSGTARIVPPGDARWAALTLAALADGVMEASLLLVYEKRVRQEPEWSATWIAMQQGKVDRGLAYLEARLPAKPAHPPTIGEIGVACALGYLDLRFEGRWRAGHPRLVAWLDAFASAVPAFEATRGKV